MVAHRSSFRVATLLAIVLTVAFAVCGRLAAAADTDDQDLKARKLFAGGEYRQALEIYVTLYAETLHPTYLRNIGRCQQNLGEADKAIASFREYLRKAKDLSASQRQEIDGFIAEMEELKRKQAGGGAAASAPAPAQPAPVNLAAPAAPAGPAPAAMISSPAPAPADDSGSPFYTRVWFWIVVGAVAAGAVAAVLLLGGGDVTKPRDMLDFREGTMP
jgi:tetratricopeptide (TPR) repeat protein